MLRDGCCGVLKHSANGGNNNNKADKRTATIYRVMVPKDRKKLVTSNATGWVLL